MVTKKLVEEIKAILCDMNRSHHKYATVWLSLNDDLTGRERYILNVKTDRTIDSCFEELDSIFDTLHKRMDGKSLQKISRIAVYNASDEVHCDSGDIMVLEEDENCAYIH